MKNIYKNLLYVFLTVYFVLIIFMCFFERTNISVQERRVTKSVPLFSLENVINKKFMIEFDNFFTDSVPYKDALVDASIVIKNFNGYQTKEKIKLVDVTSKTGITDDLTNDGKDTKSIDDYTVLDDVEKFNAVDAIDGNKLVIIGDGANVRGMNLFNGSITIGDTVAQKLNDFRSNIDPKINVYYMAIPLPSAFYMPKQLEDRWIDQKKCIDRVYDQLVGIKGIDIYDTLYRHKNEDIYFRTDYHWTQRGAYYAGEEFAKVADVDYRPLSEYEEHKVEKYCSSYYRYTEDIRFVQNPETLYYYIPKIEYDTMQVRYNTDTSSPDYIWGIDEHTTFFKKFDDGNTWAYFTFMGGDPYATVVKTKNNTGRKLVILKDSFGNCFAPNMFYSFDEVHVLDFRYYRGNINDYINAYGITDLLLENEITMMHVEASKYKDFLLPNQHSTLY